MKKMMIMQSKLIDITVISVSKTADHWGLLASDFNTNRLNDILLLNTMRTFLYKQIKFD